MTVTVPHATRNIAATPVRRTDAFREMEDLQERMGQLMDGLFGLTPPTVAVRLPAWQATADVEETDDAYIVEMDLPGVRPDDVSVDVRENELRVSGEIKERERKGILRRQTRRVGKFEQVLVLPSDVDPDQVEAKLSDGVLMVKLGKSRSRQAKHIEVKSS